MSVIGSPLTPSGSASPASIGLGWADYADTTYTSGSPFALSANTDTVLPNDGLGGIQADEPVGIDLYDISGGKLTGIEGDGRIITLDCKVLPTSASTTIIEFWFDIGGSVGGIIPSSCNFPERERGS